MEEKSFLTGVSKEEVEALKRASAYSLPDSPADQGLRAKRVKPAFYQFLTDGQYSLVALLQRIIDEANEALVSLQGEVGTKANKESVSAALDLKANAEDVEKGFADVEEALLGKAEKTDVEEALMLKASETYVNEQLGLKANATYEAISELLGFATAERAGAMSEEQAQQLATLVALLGNEDADTTINTIREVLSAFEEMPEGTALANALAGKVDKLTKVKGAVYTVNQNGVTTFKYYAHTLSPNNYATVVVRDGKTQTFEVGEPLEANNPVRLTDLNDALGDIEGALDEIIAQQTALIGGTA